MRTVQVAEAKAKFSALLASVEAGEEVLITRHGKVVARLVPETPRMAADLFRPLREEEIDIESPEDSPPEPVEGLD